MGALIWADCRPDAYGWHTSQPDKSLQWRDLRQEGHESYARMAGLEPNLPKMSGAAPRPSWPPRPDDVALDHGPLTRPLGLGG
jgi:hypothetical protein